MHKALILSELNLVFLTKIKCGIFAYITLFFVPLHIEIVVILTNHRLC